MATCSALYREAVCDTAFNWMVKNAQGHGHVLFLEGGSCRMCTRQGVLKACYKAVRSAIPSMPSAQEIHVTKQCDWQDRQHGDASFRVAPHGNLLTVQHDTESTMLLHLDDDTSALRSTECFVTSSGLTFAERNALRKRQFRWFICAGTIGDADDDDSDSSSSDSESIEGVDVVRVLPEAAAATAAAASDAKPMQTMPVAGGRPTSTPADDIHAHYGCCVCHALPGLPWTTCPGETGHLICRACYAQLVEPKRCPVCNVLCPHLVRDNALLDLMGALGVAPPLVPCDADGCHASVPLTELSQHRAVCAHSPHRCLFYDCKWSGALSALAPHLRQAHALAMRDVSGASAQEPCVLNLGDMPRNDMKSTRWLLPGDVYVTARYLQSANSYHRAIVVAFLALAPEGVGRWKAWTPSGGASWRLNISAAVGREGELRFTIPRDTRGADILSEDNVIAVPNGVRELFVMRDDIAKRKRETHEDNASPPPPASKHARYEEDKDSAC